MLLMHLVIPVAVEHVRVKGMLKGAVTSWLVAAAW
jgi:hypothetical protein